jgi:predicted 2-oxoglutarate/Fe(II)-dependent dioxygenase YbiX
MCHINEYLTDIIIRPKIFTPEECRIIYSDHSLREEAGKFADIDDYTHASRYPLKFGEQTTWIQNRLNNVVNMINRMYFNFKLTLFKEFQLLEYAENGFFDWHVDLAGKSTRKINTVVFLSELKDYQGGQLSFNIAKIPGMKDIVQEQGTMILFPAYRAHKVEPVTRGTRYSLSTIFHGDAFN